MDWKKNDLAHALVTLSKTKGLFESGFNWGQGPDHPKVEVLDEEGEVIAVYQRQCLVNALWICSNYSPSHFYQATSLICDALGGDVMPDEWNDAPGRTVPQVLDALTRAMGLAIAAEGPTPGLP